ncbi:hypothetical protein DDZ14_09090 [Maritimibacter sp. 55A14]|uniref:DUF3280 domain-containing protein n=1 Tax=Maritimibacter sp. 55A14 TaxID=2174844 RepID=UPI000D6096DC|nr:DUF3280 domain-containing protein [Maritimibacter sp. 55A14]PWE32680.1 hypothetical protein DDZ14_09090 [Maritimibacter sp. 55A14]
MRHVLCLLLACLLGAPAAARELEPLRAGADVAFLGLTFIDTSTEGAYFDPREDEAARLRMLERLVEARFTEEGFNLLDLAPVAEEMDRIKNPADCYGCELRMAERLGADYVLVGEVQKVSNLILSMNLVMRDVADGHAVRALAVDIRSNTDESWTRGMRYIFKTHFFAE